MNPEYNFYTYKDGEKCLYCGAPIADQEHASMKFCPRVVLPDGSIKSCKDDFHASKNKEKNAPYLELYNYHKETRKHIEGLHVQKGDTVTAEQLDQYSIRLDMPVKYDCDADGKSIFYFIDFCITQVSQSQFKITKHENKF